MVLVADKENAVLCYHVPSWPSTGTAKRTAEFSFRNWVILTFCHFWFFLSLPGTSDNPAGLKAPCIRKPPPRFPALRFRKRFPHSGPDEIPIRNSQPITVSPDREGQSSAFLFAVSTGKVPLFFRYEFSAGTTTHRLSCQFDFPYQYSGYFREKHLHPINLKSKFQELFFG